MIAAPSRFRHPIDGPDPLAIQYYGRFMKTRDAEPWREQADHLAASLWHGDPLADAWVAATVALGRSQAGDLFERALARGVGAVPDAPSELRALFEHLETVPLWVDPKCLELGCRTFRRTGPIASFVLSGFSLMGGYRSSAVVKPLIMTGNLRNSASRRLLDTGRFVMAVTEPGLLRQSQPGYQACARVRLLHAHIRHGLARSPEWHAEAWGLPINQADMVGTNLLFSLGFLIGARALGIAFSSEEAHSVIHLWRYAGYLLGVDEKLLPASEREAERTMYLVGASQPPPDDDSIELAHALCREPLDRASTEPQRRRARAEIALRTSISRVLLGDMAADELKLPKSALRFGVRGLVPFVSLLEGLRKTAPFGNEIAYRAGDKWIKNAMAELESARAPATRAGARHGA